MKSCTQCGLEATDDVPACVSCGRLFSFVARSDGTSPNLLASMTSLVGRPDGSTALAWCKGLGVAAAIFAVIALLGGRGAISPSTDLDMLFAASLRMANALFWIALLVGLVGYVVRAISFLPGRDD